MTVVSADVLDKTGAYPAEPNVLRKMKSKKKEENKNIRENKVCKNVILLYYKQQMSSSDYKERRQPTTLLWADLTQY